MFVIPTELRQSPVHGVGVFLLVPVKKDALVWRFDPRLDQVIPDHAIENLPEAARRYILIHAPWHQGSRAYVLSGDNARYTNHSMLPNTYSVDKDCFAESYAARDLEIGEEITTNYFEEYDNKDLLEKMQLR